MINFQMKQFNLYKNITEKNSIGESIDNWIYENQIYVSVNHVNINQINVDLIYKDCEFRGLTEFKGFSLSEDYKISNESEEYLIKNINQFSRLTQLVLKAVV